jgi:hypothetical protein
MEDLFEGYRDAGVSRSNAVPFDEMFSESQTPRAPYEMVHEALSHMSRGELSLEH